MHYMLPNNFTREVDWCPGSSCESDISHFCGVTLTSDHLLSSVLRVQVQSCAFRKVHSCGILPNGHERSSTNVSSNITAGCTLKHQDLTSCSGFATVTKCCPFHFCGARSKSCDRCNETKVFFPTQHALNEDKLHFKKN